MIAAHGHTIAHRHHSSEHATSPAALKTVLHLRAPQRTSSTDRPLRLIRTWALDPDSDLAMSPTCPHQVHQRGLGVKPKSALLPAAVTVKHPIEGDDEFSHARARRQASSSQLGIRRPPIAQQQRWNRVSVDSPSTACTAPSLATGQVRSSHNGQALGSSQLRGTPVRFCLALVRSATTCD